MTETAKGRLAAVGSVIALALVAASWLLLPWPAQAAPRTTTNYAHALEVVLPIVWNQEQPKHRQFHDMRCHRAGKMMTFNVWSCTTRLVNSNDHSTRTYTFIVTGWGEVLQSRWV